MLLYSLLLNHLKRLKFLFKISQEFKLKVLLWTDG